MVFPLFSKKQPFKTCNKLQNNYETLFNFKKKQVNKKIIYDADISFPVFLKKIHSFILHGLKLRKKKKKSHINQTLTIQTKLSKQLITLTVNAICPLVKIR